ncbi:MAG: hypothetical protein WCA16_20630 [Candidatus Sulfotelmatobacter sp.]
MQNFLDKYPLALIPVFLLFWYAILFILSALSGWMDLARHFRLTSTFTGPTWGFQSARMRWTSHYGSCLNVGADPAGVKLSVLFPFRPGHPPLLIPWSEISVASRRKFLFIRRVKLLLGREEQIPFVISGGLADRIQAAAGTNWPVEPVS